MALAEAGLADPIELLRHEAFRGIVDVFRNLRVPDADDMARTLRDSVRRYGEAQRGAIWRKAIERAPNPVNEILERTQHSRGKVFEQCIEELLDGVGIAYERLDDGKTPGAADLVVGRNHPVPLVMEFKTSEGESTIGLNEALDVIKGAAVVEAGHLPKATLVNPAFDPNVPWQARRIPDLSLIEACQFAYGIALLAGDEIDKGTFLDWLTQPGMCVARQLLAKGNLSDAA